MNYAFAIAEEQLRYEERQRALNAYWMLQSVAAGQGSKEAFNAITKQLKSTEPKTAPSSTVGTAKHTAAALKNKALSEAVANGFTPAIIIEG